MGVNKLLLLVAVALALVACTTVLASPLSEESLVNWSVDGAAESILAELEASSEMEAASAASEAEFNEGEAASFLESETEADSDADTELTDATWADSETEGDLTDAAWADMETESPEDLLMAETESESTVSDDDDSGDSDGGDDAAAPANPSYTLPYPPVLPGHYTPLFNPYTNVNPLSTPFSNYAAQPGAHPGVAAAAAAQAGGLAAVNGQIAGAAGGYPYYPFAGRSPIMAGQLAGNPVPFSGYAGWIHPQNLNSAAVGDNDDAASLGQFLEIATEEMDHGECQGCSY